MTYIHKVKSCNTKVIRSNKKMEEQVHHNMNKNKIIYETNTKNKWLRLLMDENDND